MGDWDVIVVGGGHAGVEAAHAAARIGVRVALVTTSRASIATLPCNCSIGGPAKGHLVREIDALGGLMAEVTDASLTHIRMLNTGKGPAVHALRAQVDIDVYPKLMATLVDEHPLITIIEGMVSRILTESRPDAVLEISLKGLGFTAIVNPYSEPIGIFTDGDLRRMLQKQTDFSNPL